MLLKSVLLFVLAPLAALAKNHVVHVGEVGITYIPQNITAEPGDKVHFFYYPGDHGVAEGDLAHPCTPKKGGFWSGFMNVKSRPGVTSFVLTVNHTEPIFIYCPNSDHHCQGGMSMVINGGMDQLLKYKEGAAQTTMSVVPKKIQGGKFHHN